MLGQSMIGAGPTLALVLGVRTALSPQHRAWGLAGAAVGLAETLFCWLSLWPGLCGGGAGMNP